MLMKQRTAAFLLAAVLCLLTACAGGGELKAPTQVEGTAPTPTQAPQKETQATEAPETEPVTEEAPVVYKTTTTLNVRSGPGTENDRIGKLDPDQTVDFVRDHNEEWAVIMYNDQEAYVAKEYLTIAE